MIDRLEMFRQRSRLPDSCINATRVMPGKASTTSTLFAMPNRSCRASAVSSIFSGAASSVSAPFPDRPDAALHTACRVFLLSRKGSAPQGGFLPCYPYDSLWAPLPLLPHQRTLLGWQALPGLRQSLCRRASRAGREPPGHHTDTPCTLTAKLH